ncbi:MULTISPECIES: hypothetical protein [unclassified Agrobacterium]|uniref:hypothetical protein n=1 Tax=unclassified Agrobacterium TaxID=2632611 RepID=UPI001FCAE2BC|nr:MULTISPECIES: hypothetical protein [unclassified Agrobacterium]
MIAAAIELFPFFFGTSKKNSRIIRRLASTSKEPKMTRTRSNTHSSHASPYVGWPMISGTRSRLKMRSAFSASKSNSGNFGTRDLRCMIRSFQSGHAVDQSRSIFALGLERAINSPFL